MVAGDIEWMSAGRGVWHSCFAVPPVKAFQLWVALPPERELAPAFSQHRSVNDIPSDGPARVLLGRSGEAVSPIDAPPGVNCLVVHQDRPALGLPAAAGLPGRLDRNIGR